MTDNFARASEVTGNAYEEAFRKVLSEIKTLGIENLVCGDIHLLEHRKWLERVVNEQGLSPIFPLWNRPTEDLLADFLSRGYEAVIVATRARFMGEEWLGCSIDGRFRQKLEGLPRKVNPCGESGEFHTLVITGPDWPGRLKILETAPFQATACRNDQWFLNITKWQVDSYCLA